MAAESPQVRERAEVEYFAMQSRSALNREPSGRLPFDWTLNPYRGCELGCKYCYARYTHEFMELHDGGDFERKIFVKANMHELLEAELRRAKDRGLAIALGTATDPYQPAEKQFEITRRVLEVVARLEGLHLGITTKSVLILRDLDLLRRITERHQFSVHITVTTMNSRLARLLEPKAPPPAKRMQAVKELAANHVPVSVNAMPIIPGLTDDPESLEAVVRNAAAAGASNVYGNTLFLMPSAMAEFMPFLEREFPHLVARYRQLYAHSAYLNGDYKSTLSKLMADLRMRYELDYSQQRTPAQTARGQLTLDFHR
jgi:DNA repair photolyase